MGFSIRALSVLAYANGFTLWHYKTGAAPAADAGRDGFFNEAADMLAVGDILMVSGAAGARVMAVARSGLASGVLLAPLG